MHSRLGNYRQNTTISRCRIDRHNKLVRYGRLRRHSSLGRHMSCMHQHDRAVTLATTSNSWVQKGEANQKQQLSDCTCEYIKALISAKARN